jgi:hypothetical protein
VSKVVKSVHGAKMSGPTNVFSIARKAGAEPQQEVQPAPVLERELFPASPDECPSPRAAPKEDVTLDEANWPPLLKPSTPSPSWSEVLRGQRSAQQSSTSETAKQEVNTPSRAFSYAREITYRRSTGAGEKNNERAGGEQQRSFRIGMIRHTVDVNAPSSPPPSSSLTPPSSPPRSSSLAMPMPMYYTISTHLYAPSEGIPGSPRRESSALQKQRCNQNDLGYPVPSSETTCSCWISTTLTANG